MVPIHVFDEELVIRYLCVRVLYAVVLTPLFGERLYVGLVKRGQSSAHVLLVVIFVSCLHHDSWLAMSVGGFSCSLSPISMCTSLK